MYQFYLEVEIPDMKLAQQDWCDLLSLRTFFSVTSTPQRSQMILCNFFCIFHKHIQNLLLVQNSFTEKTITLRFVRTVVDRFWLQNFTSWFFQDRFRRSKSNRYFVESFTGFLSLLLLFLLFIIVFTIDLFAIKIKIDYSHETLLRFSLLPRITSLNFKLF
jgi:hypothetical protein